MEHMTRAYRVALVDDEQLVRAGLRLVLEGDPALTVVGEASDGREALDLVARTDPDVVLMDIRMPHMNGIAATERLLAANAERTVIILTTFDTDEFMYEALRRGARGFLLKDMPPRELVDAVRRAAEGERMLSQSALSWLIGEATGPNARGVVGPQLDSLTGRERDIAIGVAKGLSNAEIAAELFVSVTTVKTHVGRILDKLGADNRVQIANAVNGAPGRGSRE
ncbi:response regulator transcription factor [Paramicrobacterium chengjingii]|uniref:Response regulator transcription factor n=2 Tax=Paramicrobacterium chengjingii TaxID=2769067 RepID=A0ABX6YK38_9MICO|nr:response regulator transcription factor [Microbacterium chengjingii]